MILWKKWLQMLLNFLIDVSQTLIVDGPLQSDFALNKMMLKNKFEFSKLSGQKVNVLVFPNLDSANITYKVIKELMELNRLGPF